VHLFESQNVFLQMGEESERQGGGSGLIHTQPTAASPSSWPFGLGAHPVSEFLAQGKFRGIPTNSNGHKNECPSCYMSQNLLIMMAHMYLSSS
jgi:hypothetical protein